MAKRKPLKGKDLMIFVDGKAIALATSHTLTLNAETSDTASKDSVSLVSAFSVSV